MAETAPPPEEKPTKPLEQGAEKPADDSPSKGDIAAIGIGCLVFVIFFIAIVIVGAMRE